MKSGEKKSAFFPNIFTIFFFSFWAAARDPRDPMAPGTNIHPVLNMAPLQWYNFYSNHPALGILAVLVSFPKIILPRPYNHLEYWIESLDLTPQLPGLGKSIIATRHSTLRGKTDKLKEPVNKELNITRS